jgi:hypothetical protein
LATGASKRLGEKHASSSNIPSTKNWWSGKRVFSGHASSGIAILEDHLGFFNIMRRRQ